MIAKRRLNGRIAWARSKMRQLTKSAVDRAKFGDAIRVGRATTHRGPRTGHFGPVDADIGPPVVVGDINADRCPVCGGRDNLLPFAIMPRRLFLGVICVACAHETPCSPERSPYRVFRTINYGRAPTRKASLHLDSGDLIGESSLELDLEDLGD